VEHNAAQAEANAALALAAVKAGDWRKALRHSRRVWALEFATGRPLRSETHTWLRFAQTVEEAARAHQDAVDEGGGD